MMNNSIDRAIDIAREQWENDHDDAIAIVMIGDAHASIDQFDIELMREINIESCVIGLRDIARDDDHAFRMIIRMGNIDGGDSIIIFDQLIA